jgi:dGTPase
VDGGYRYGRRDLARRCPGPPEIGPGGPFAADRLEIVRSSALRRLAGRTQVLGARESAGARTRLTHSLEVGALARAIGSALGAAPDLVESAGLAHDLGHPPFGHAGERALDEVAGPCGGFESNAQAFRILTRLERAPEEGTGVGGCLGLTRAVLDATVKYPWPRRAGTGKFGYYAADVEAFDWVRDGAVGARRSFEAEVMEWADDIAYAVHDVEDTVEAGLLDLRELAALRHEGPGPAGGPIWPGASRGYDGTATSATALRYAGRAVLARFVDAVVTATREHRDGRPAGRYDGELVLPPWAAAEVAVLKDVVARRVLAAPSRLAAYARQRELLHELVAAALAAGPRVLTPRSRVTWHAAGDDAARLRAVIDHVAALTESEAVRSMRTLRAAAGSGPATVLAGASATARGAAAHLC